MSRVEGRKSEREDDASPVIGTNVEKAANALHPDHSLVG